MFKIKDLHAIFEYKLDSRGNYLFWKFEGLCDFAQPIVITDFSKLIIIAAVNFLEFLQSFLDVAVVRMLWLSIF